MKILIIGAGGTGGALAAVLARAGEDVTLIARGEHLAAIRERGLTLRHPEGDFTVRVDACTMEEYASRGIAPECALVCVKGYSLDSAASFLAHVANEQTLVVPILNIYGTGAQLQRLVPQATVTDGCMYIVSQKEGPGVITMGGKILRVVFGLRQDTAPAVREAAQPRLEALHEALTRAGVKSILSEQIEADAFRKFTYISPVATLGAALGTRARDMQPGGAHREDFVALIGELVAIAEQRGIALPPDIVEINLALIDHTAPDVTASMQRDTEAGRLSEIQGLTYEILNMARDSGTQAPTYKRLAAIAREKGL